MDLSPAHKVTPLTLTNILPDVNLEEIKIVPLESLTDDML
jgi:hypothetical protein